LSLVDLHRLPKHVAIVMDGNGRWAQSLGRVRTRGHEQGSKTVRSVVRAARRLGVEALTLYAFSAQNWNRPSFEVSALMELLRRYLVSEREELLENDIRLRAVGRVARLPSRVREVLDPLAADTAHLTGMTLSLALSYGGREELVDAARVTAERARGGELDAAAVDEALLDSLVPSYEVGPVDLLIRTGGEQRISNFMLWGSAYAELHFTETLWPDFDENDLYAAIAAFQGRDRRFGLITAAEPDTPPAVDDNIARAASE
jgi:undecaprenyl diphosphate synthase